MSMNDQERIEVINAVITEVETEKILHETTVGTITKLYRFYLAHKDSPDVIAQLIADSKITTRKDTAITTAISKAFLALAKQEVRQRRWIDWVARRSRVMQYLEAIGLVEEQAVLDHFAANGGWSRVLAIAYGERLPDEIVNDDAEDGGESDGGADGNDDQDAEADSHGDDNGGHGGGAVLPDGAIEQARHDLPAANPRVRHILDKLLALPQSERWHELLRMMAKMEDDLRDAERFAQAKPVTAATVAEPKPEQPRTRRVVAKPKQPIVQVVTPNVRAPAEAVAA